MRSRRAILALGSNVGNRAKNLRWALREISRLRSCRLVKFSRFYETAPVGPSTRNYLNAAAVVSTTRTAMGLLMEFKRLEALAGRRISPRWSKRALDIDIIVLGRERIRTPWLKVPHPRACSRPFVLAPLAEIAPKEILRGKTALQRMSTFKASGRSVKLWRDGL